MTNRLHVLGVLLIALAALMSASVLVLSSCGVANSNPDDDDDTVSHADKVQITCRHIADCGFATDLGIQNCAVSADKMSDWLLNCAVAAKGCGDLADCFNLPEATTP